MVLGGLEMKNSQWIFFPLWLGDECESLVANVECNEAIVIFHILLVVAECKDLGGEFLLLGLD